MFKVECGVLQSGHRLVGARWSEGLSELFEVEVFVAVPAAEAFEIEDALWLEAAFIIDTPRGEAPFYGVVGRCEEVFSVAGVQDDVIGSAGTYYRFVIVPRAARLVETQDSRVWTTRTLGEVLKDVFDRAGLKGGSEVELAFDDREAEDQITQYRESDYTFLCRWAEREGIYFLFRHQDGVDKLVLCDDWGQHDVDAGTFRFHGTLGSSGGGEDATAAEAFHRFGERLSMGPKLVAIADRVEYPAPAPVAGESELKEAKGRSTLRRFGQRVFDDGRAADLARFAAEALDAERHVFVGEGGALGVRPGSTFGLTGHTIPRLDARYRVTAASGVWNEHWQNGELSARLGLPAKRFWSKVVAIGEGKPFRAPQRTPWAHVAGLEPAFVDGEGGGDYAQLDAEGRYVVRFRFDGASNDPGKASTRIRMAQPHAGAPEGWHFPLRKETEVVTTFLHGDPDRPLLLGAVANPLTPSAVTSANGTKDVLRTGGTTRLEIEDQEGSQWAWLWTPVEDTYLYWGAPSKPTHHVVAHTDGNAFYDVGTNQDVRVGAKLFEQVKGAVLETYDTSMDTFVDGPQITIVSSDVEEIYGDTQTTHTQGAVLELYGAKQDTDVNAAGRKETFDGGQLTLVSGAIEEKVAGGMTKIVNGPTVQGIGGALSTTVSGGPTTLTYGSAVLQKWGATTATIANLDVKIPGGVIHVGTNVTIDSPGQGWLGTVHTEITNMKLEVEGFRTEQFGIKLEGNPFAVAVTPLKAERNLILVEALGLGIELGTEGVQEYGKDIGTFGLVVLL